MAKSRQQKKFDTLTTAISRVVTPVMICMILAVWLVNSLGDPSTCAPVQESQPKRGPLGIDPMESSQTRSSTNLVFGRDAALIFVGVFLGLVIVFTFLIVWLYKKGHTRIIQGWLVLAVFVIFGYVGGIYIFEFCRSRCINLDWVTLCFAVWNFTITGLVAVFSAVPRIVNQAYLIVMSALMAYIFRTLPQWSTWTILGALVIWDLFAVLAPWGPLRMLVESARERGDPLPALVYDTNPSDIGRDGNRDFPSVNNKRHKTRPPADGGEDGMTVTVQSRSESEGNGATRRKRHRDPNNRDENNGESEPVQAGTSTRERRESGDHHVGTLGAHLKLGLGDFVFYSVLVAQASRDGGAMTTFTSFVAILAGLCATLFLVTIYRKALPALPISITAGIFFFFLTKYTVQPFILNLVVEILLH